MDLQIIVFVLYVLLFLLGMGIMSSAMHHLAGRRMRDTLQRAARTPLKGLTIGTLASMLLQSSSAVTIITVGLIGAHAMSFSQSVGIILGANIGTTVTGEIAALPVGSLHYVFFGAGVILMCLPFRQSFSIGSFLLGIGCLFASMAGFSSLAEPLAGSSFIRDLLVDANGSLIYAVVVGTLFSAIIQSSSATMLVCMGFLDHNILTLPAAIAIMFGSNIGTCVTTYIASLGTGRQGRWTAYTHILFNVLSVVIFFPFIHPLANLSMMIAGDGRTALAHTSVIFNLITALLAVPLAEPYGRWVEKNRL
ncbi:Na/Pi cotransporter family protein [Sporolactobacillus shoreae]|uniref:Na/Pi cotransporter family protein n=1 Tax=Sporolactobacillus shoreae TaxID=1465501 RepID=A0A4Z0GSS4_9BACL|nr:Na/Pi symporter [Sporolactobacillus shoreae]TGA99577.1 Na/Pi cotransporter family protein [Sporolactobacillus shoreae]